jgi:uncharacterized protein
MNKRELIRDFISSKRIAVAGVSRNTKKFGYILFRDLTAKGYDAIPVNPNLSEIEGVKCYNSVNDIPGEINCVVTAIPPARTEELVDNLSRTDVNIIWMQSGSESNEAVNKCSLKGIEVITRECILMYAKPEGFHKFHRFIRKLFGGVPV